jgi:hypothetical protein
MNLTNEEAAKVIEALEGCKVVTNQSMGWMEFDEIKTTAALAILQAAKDRPIVTHLNMDPNASEETKTAVGDVIRAAYDFKPGGSLSVNIRTWRDKIADLKPHRIDSLADHAERLEAELAASKDRPQPAVDRLIKAGNGIEGFMLEAADLATIGAEPTEEWNERRSKARGAWTAAKSAAPAKVEVDTIDVWLTPRDMERLRKPGGWASALYAYEIPPPSIRARLTKLFNATT